MSATQFQTMKLHGVKKMSFKNYAVNALTLSIRGWGDIIKVSQLAGYTTVC